MKLETAMTLKTLHCKRSLESKLHHMNMTGTTSLKSNVIWNNKHQYSHCYNEFYKSTWTWRAKVLFGPGPPNIVSVLVCGVAGGVAVGFWVTISMHLLFSLQAQFTICWISSTKSIISLLDNVSFIYLLIAAMPDPHIPAFQHAWGVF